MKRIIAVNLVFLLLVFPSLSMAKEKRGTNLVVQTKDEQTFRGELITVKQYALLLLNEEGADVTVDIREVRNLTIVNKSKAGKGFGYGALIGGGTLALAMASEGGPDIEAWILRAAVFGAFIGGVIGAIFGAAAGQDDTILVSTKTKDEIQEILNQLRSIARVPNYQ